MYGYGVEQSLNIQCCRRNSSTMLCQNDSNPLSARCLEEKCGQNVFQGAAGQCSQVGLLSGSHSCRLWRSFLSALADVASDPGKICCFWLFDHIRHSCRIAVIVNVLTNQLRPNRRHVVFGLEGNKEKSSCTRPRVSRNSFQAPEYMLPGLV